MSAVRWTIAGPASSVCPIDDVAAYKGPTGTVQARITGLLKAVDELRVAARHRPQGRPIRRVDVGPAGGTVGAPRRQPLSMPSATQRSALRAVSADLDQLDAELMTFLVGTTARPDQRLHRGDRRLTCPTPTTTGWRLIRGTGFRGARQPACRPRVTHSAVAHCRTRPS